jgi:hypothetical protein
MHQLIVSKSWDSPSHPHVKENEAAYFINKATIPNTLAKFTPQFSTAQLIPGSYSHRRIKQQE